MIFMDFGKATMNKEKGQSLVEFSLFLILGFIALFPVFDVLLFAANIALAGIVSFNMSREASVFYAGDGSTCASIVLAAQDVTEPIGQADWQYSVTPCPDDPYWVTPAGKVSAIVTVTYDPMFIPGDPWLFEFVTKNTFQ